MNSEFLFKVTDLHKSFGDYQVLKGVNLNIKPNSSLVILGGSGSGKSVLIKTMVGLLKPESGSVWYNDTQVNNMSFAEHLVMLEDFGYLFQAGALFDSLTVQQNITFFAEKIQKLTRSARQDLAAQKLTDVGLDTRILNLYPAELSGGMQKRVALARAICTNPKVLFFDEPTTGLDPIMSNVINDLIIKVRDQLQATTITITHDMNSARRIGEQVSFLYQGKIVWDGSIADIDDSGNQLLDNFVKGNYQK